MEQGKLQSTHVTSLCNPCSSNRTTSIHASTNDFLTIWTWNSTVMIFLYADHHQIWSIWQMNSRNISWSAGCSGNEPMQIDGHSRIEGPGSNKPQRTSWTLKNIKRSGQCCQYMTEQRFDIGFSSKKIMRDAAGPTASRTKLKRIARYLKGRQRCALNFLWLPCWTTSLM